MQEIFIFVLHADHLHIRIAAAVLLQQVRVDGVPHQGTKPDPEHLPLGGKGLDHLLHLLILLEDRRHGAQQHLGLLRHEQVVLVPLEQRHAALLLQLPDAGGDRRLGHIQLPGRLGEIQAGTDRRKVPHLGQCHSLIPLPSALYS